MNTPNNNKSRRKKKKRDLKSGICEILGDTETPEINIGNVRIQGVNRKGKGITRHYKDGLEALEDN